MSYPTRTPDERPDMRLEAYRGANPQPDWYIYREGNEIVFTNGVPFPDVCLQCGAHAPTAVRKTLFWHTPLLYLMVIFPGWLVYAIVAMIVRERAVVALPLCDAHRARRRWWIAGAWSSFVGAFAFPAAACSLVSDGHGDVSWSFAMIPFGILVSLVCVLVGVRIVTPTYINKYMVKARGAGEGFLRRCPPMPTQAPTPLGEIR